MPAGMKAKRSKSKPPTSNNHAIIPDPRAMMAGPHNSPFLFWNFAVELPTVRKQPVSEHSAPRALGAHPANHDDATARPLAGNPKEIPTHAPQQRNQGATIHPFLKWAGGKRWFVQDCPELLPLSYGRYLEPFLGSAAVYFHMRPRAALLSTKR